MTKMFAANKKAAETKNFHGFKNLKYLVNHEDKMLIEINGKKRIL